MPLSATTTAPTLHELHELVEDFATGLADKADLHAALHAVEHQLTTTSQETA